MNRRLRTLSLALLLPAAAAGAVVVSSFHPELGDDLRDRGHGGGLEAGAVVHDAASVVAPLPASMRST